MAGKGGFEFYANTRKMHQLLVVVIDKYNVIFFGLQSINGFDTTVEKFKTLITLIQK